MHMRYTNKPFRAPLLAGLCLALAPLVLPAQTVRSEYEIINYERPAVDNPVADLVARLASGELSLEYRPPFGYLESLLEALGVSPDSQTLVFSKTSLQYGQIDASRPRAIYFSDDAYVAWVRDSRVIELTAMDARLGAMFYVFNNDPEIKQPVERQDGRCLVCHDANGLMGGGVPLLLARSSLYDRRYEKLVDLSGTGNVVDSTPVHERWGGWYVTGISGKQSHLGNLILDSASQLDEVDSLRITNLETLEGQGFFDTSRYLRPTSDIVALMLLEHQLTVQNQITYVRFKAPAVLERVGHPEVIAEHSWDELPHNAQRSLMRMLDKLVDALLLKDAAPLEDRLVGNAAYREWFEAQGPADAQGRSLRRLDLETRLLYYPLSYLIHSDDFHLLPDFVRDYVWRAIAEALKGNDSPLYRETLAILEATEPEAWQRWFATP